MQSNPTNSEMNYKLNWSEAAKYGLILASVSVVINLVTSIFQLPAVLNVLLSVIKLCGSVYIDTGSLSVSAWRHALSQP